jgi:PIN domain nuclease of toxin-antitoxin system
LLSAASGWEIALLWHLKRVELPDLPQRFIPKALQKLSVIPLHIGFCSNARRDVFSLCLPAVILEGQVL